MQFCLELYIIIATTFNDIPSSETHGQSRIVSVCETGRGFPSLSDDGINDIHVIPNLVL